MASQWTPGQIAAIVGCPEPNVWKYWPPILSALESRGIGDKPVQIAALATIGVEAGSFEPVREAYWLSEAERNAYLTRMYEGREDLGNTQPGDGIRFAGRSFIQLTGRSNYRTYGAKLGVGLEDNPDLALDPNVAAHVFAVYFTEHRIRWEPAPAPLMNVADLARAGEWRGVRIAVNGGTNGLARFMEIVNALQGASPVPTVPPFNPDAPIDVQPDPWSCSIQAVQWLLRSIGRNPDASDPHGDPWLRSQLVPALVTPELGLLDGSGAQLAAWITREYGQEMGFTAHAADVTFDDVLAGAGVNPTLIGGRKWGPGGHWAGVRRADENGWLELANPSPNYTGIGSHLDRSEWDARGPWSAIFIDRAALLGQQPEPPVPPRPPADTRLARARALLEQAIAVLDEPAPG